MTVELPLEFCAELPGQLDLTSDHPGELRRRAGAVHDPQLGAVRETFPDHGTIGTLPGGLPEFVEHCKQRIRHGMPLRR